MIGMMNPATTRGIYPILDENLGASTSRQNIRLELPRPDTLRSRNEYVQVEKTPVRPPRLPKKQRQHHRNERSSICDSSSSGTASNVGGKTDHLRISQHRDRSTPAAISSANSRRSLVPAMENSKEIDSRPALSSAKMNKVNDSRTFSSTNTDDRRTTDRRFEPSSDHRTFDPPGRVIRVVATSTAVVSSKTRSTLVVNEQPRSISTKSDHHKTHRLPPCSSSSSLLDSSSIICKQCGRCRCAQCATPPSLPSRLICGDHCELSSNSVVDALSCMCCVKACLYHTTGHVYDGCLNGYDGDEDDRGAVGNYYENGVVCDCDASSSTSTNGGGGGTMGICGAHSLWSCSRKSPDRCLRWTVLGWAAACLPCLWAYVPLRACANGVEAAYVKWHDQGCRCRDRDGGQRPRRHRTTSSSENCGANRHGRSVLPPELPSMVNKRRAASSVDLNRRIDMSKSDLIDRINGTNVRRYSLVSTSDKR